MATNLLNILSECKRIIKNRSHHFTILFLIFLLPVSISFQILIFSSNIPQTQLQQQSEQTTNPFFYLPYFLFVLIFYTCALSTITYSVYHSFYGRPLKLLSTINSIPSSFLPLLPLSCLPSCFLLGFLFILGFEIINVTSLPFCPYLVVLPLVLYLKVKWTLAPVIVVVESCWGLEPLRKSTMLMRGMEGVALSHLLISGFWMCMCSRLTRGLYEITHDGWANNGVIIGLSSCLFATFLLKDIAFCAILYIDCKTNHDELEVHLGKDHVN